jgi:hypothetical protein
MSRKLVSAIFALAFLLMFSGSLIVGNNSFAFAQASQLKIYVGMPSVPADNQSYRVIFVQLQDSSGIPVRATQDMQISLSSSLVNIGKVDSSITVKQGSSYESANFYSTFTPGVTTITAAASGYGTVQVPMTTVGPIPSMLSVYTIPPVLPADGGSYPAVIVQLEDSSGNPARAPSEGIQVTLSCSNSTVGNVDNKVTILGGETYAVANFMTNSIGASAAGSAAIVSIASGYTSKQATIATQNTVDSSSSSPINLKVYVAPPRVMADKINYGQIVVVQLQTAAGKIAKAPNLVSVSLSSSSVNVGTVEPVISIPKNSSYGFAKFYSTYLAGSTTIMAAATDYNNAQATLQTVGPIPSKIAVYCAPSMLPSDRTSFQAVMVQLQDSQGRPAKDPVGDVVVSLFSSNPEAGNVSSALTIRYGRSSATGTFYSGYAANSTTITAQASGYEPGQALMTTALIDKFDLQVSVTADRNPIKPGATTNLTIAVTYEGVSPASGVALNFSSGANINASTCLSDIKYAGNGCYSVVFTAPSGSKTVAYVLTAIASKVGYNVGLGNITITSSPSAGTNQTVPNQTIQIRLTQKDGTPIIDATVTSQSMPPGSEVLSDVSNSSGYVTFTEVLAGSYKFQISRDGYVSQSQNIQVGAGQTIAYAYNLVPPPSQLPMIIGILVGVIVLLVVVGLLVRRHRRLNPPQRSIFKGYDPTKTSF